MKDKGPYYKMRDDGPSAYDLSGWRDYAHRGGKVQVVEIPVRTRDEPRLAAASIIDRVIGVMLTIQFVAVLLLLLYGLLLDKSTLYLLVLSVWMYVVFNSMWLRRIWRELRGRDKERWG